MPLRFDTARSARPSPRPNHGRMTVYPHDDHADGRTRSPLRLRIVSGGRSRPEMAPQRLEKIESAPGNGMGSEASNPQHLGLRPAAADRARSRPRAAGMAKVVRVRNTQAVPPFCETNLDWTPLRRHAETSEPIPCPSLRAKRRFHGGRIAAGRVAD